MAESRTFGELLIADLALVLDIAPARDVALALQRFWERKAEENVRLVDELQRIAGLPDESVRRLLDEAERLIEEAGGDPRLALGHRGGLDRTIHLELSVVDAPLVRALTEVGAGARSPLRTVEDERYLDFSSIGRGGMGVVYLALDTELNRRVALKIVRPDQFGVTSTEDTSPLDLVPPVQNTPASEAFKSLSARFLQEAWVTGGLEHPGIVPVYELGQTPAGIPYYTMRFVKGDRTLENSISEACSLEDRLALLEPFLKVCDTLRYAHSRGVLHRDLKPANIALGEFGEVVLLDWGLAKLKDWPDLAGSRWQERVKEFRETEDLATAIGAMGTPGYMAPEALLGNQADVDEQSDVYSLGAMLYRILTGNRPYEFDNYPELVAKALEEDPSSPLDVEPLLPESLSSICLRALQREKPNRIPSVEVLADEIRASQRESAIDREVAALVGQAEGILKGAAPLRGQALLGSLDQLGAVCARVLELRPGHERTFEIDRRAKDLRRTAMKERERAVRSALLKRVAAVGLLLVAVLGAIVIAVIEQRRKSAEAARREAERDRVRAETAEGQTALALRRAESAAEERQAALHDLREESAARADALARMRVLGLVATARDAAARGFHTTSLLLARAALQLDADHSGAHSTLRAALEHPLEQVRLGGEDCELSQAMFSPDGNHILSFGGYGRIPSLWATSGKLVLASLRQGGISLLAVSNSGDRVACLRGKTIEIYDAAGERVAEAGKHLASVNGAAFSPDGGTLISWSGDCTALLHLLKGGERISLIGHAGPVLCAAFSPDGKHVVTGSADGAARIWTRTGQAVAAMRGQSYSVTAVCYLVPGDRIVTASRDRTVRIWDTEGNSLAVLRGHRSTRIKLIPAPGGERLLTLGGGEVGVWDRDGSEVARFSGHSRFIHSAEYSPDGKRIVTASADATAAIWSRDGKLIFNLEGHDGEVDSALFSDDGEFVLTASDDGTARVWDRNGRECEKYTDPNGSLNAALFVPRANTLLTIADNGTATLWRRGSHVQTTTFVTGVPHAKFQLMGGGRLVCGGRYIDLPVWDMTGREVARIGGPEKGASLPRSVRAACFTKNGDAILLAEGRMVRAYDREGEVVATFGEHGSTIDAVASTLSGDVVVTATQGGEVRVWNADAKPKAAVQVEGPDERTGDRVYVGISASGERFLTQTRTSADLFDLTGRRLASVQSGAKKLGGARISPSGELFLTWEEHSTGVLWDSSGKRIAKLGGEVWDAEFHPTYEVFAVARPSGWAAVYNSKGRELANVNSFGVSKGGWSGSEVHLVRWHPGEMRLLTVSEGREAKIWSIRRSGGTLDWALPMQSRVTSAEFSRDGRRVITVSERGIASVWESDPHPSVKVGDEFTRFAEWSPDGSRMLTLTFGGRGEVWDTAGQMIGQFGDPESSFPLQYSGEGRILVPAPGFAAEIVNQDGEMICRLVSPGVGFTFARPLAGGKRIVTRTRSGAVHLWDMSGRMLAELLLSSDSSADIQFDRDGGRILMEAEEKLSVWDLDGRAVVLPDALQTGDLRHILPSGGFLVVKDAEGRHQLWGLDGRRRGTFEGEAEELEGFTASSSDEYIAAVRSDGTIGVWAQDGRRHAVLDAGAGQKLLPRPFSPSGRLLLTVTGETELLLWRTDGELLARLPFRLAGMSHAVFLEDETHLLIASPLGNGIHVYNLESGKLQELSPSREGGADAGLPWLSPGIFGERPVLGTVQVSPRRDRVLIGQMDGSILLFDKSGEMLAEVLPGDRPGVDGTRSLGAFSPDGSRFWIRASRDSAAVWDADGYVLGSVRLPDRDIKDAVFWPNPDQLLVDCGSSPRQLILVKVDSGKSSLLRSLGVEDGDTLDARWLPSSHRILMACGAVAYLREENGAVAVRFAGHDAGITTLDWSPESQMALTGAKDGEVRVWKRDGTLLIRMDCGSPVTWARFLPNGDRIFVACGDGKARILDLAGNEVAAVNHEAAYFSGPPAIAPAGDAVATATGGYGTGAQHEAHIWRANGERITTLRGHGDKIRAVTFSHCGEFIATASEDRTARVWRLDGTEVCVLRGHSGTVNHVSFSPRGDQVATASEDRTAMLWNLAGENLGVFRVPREVVDRVEFSPGGEFLLVVPAGERAHLVVARPEGLLEEARSRSVRNFSREERARASELLPAADAPPDTGDEGDLASAAARARSVENGENWSLAGALWESVIARAPHQPSGWFALARCWFAEGELADAHDVLVRAAEQTGVSGFPIEEWLLSSLDEHEDQPASLVHLAEALVELRREDPFAWQRLGEARMKNQEHQSAADAFRRALELADRLHAREIALINAELGRALLAGERAKEACVPLKKAIEIDPECANWHSSYSDCLLALEDLEGVVKARERATRLSPLSPGSWKRLGDAHMKRNDYASALPAYDRAVELSGNSIARRRAYRLGDRGMALGRLGRWEEAARDLEESVRLDPGVANMHWWLAHCLNRLNRFEEAHAAAARGLQRRPSGSAKEGLEQVQRDAKLLMNLQSSLPRSSAMVITGTVKDSQATASGLRAGDVVLEVNGHPVSTLTEFREKWRPIAEADPATLTIWRQGREFEAELHGGRIGVHLYEMSRKE